MSFASSAAELMDEPAQALLELGRMLRAERYAFTSVTPETQRRVNARAVARGHGVASSLRDVFGWNRVFEPTFLSRPMLNAMLTAEVVEITGSELRSRVRFSSLGEKLFVHSSFPTLEPSTVFFGPDTFRFCRLLERWAPRCRRLIDVGCGSGAGAIMLADRSDARVLVDINRRALQFSAVNAALHDTSVELIESDVLAQVEGSADLIIANPPYMRDSCGRVYRDGGGAFGEALAVRIVEQALERLTPNGTLIVYTGSAIVKEADTFFDRVLPLLRDYGGTFEYEELDPDVFGEELERPQYAEVDRIAVVGLRVTRSAG